MTTPARKTAAKKAAPRKVSPAQAEAEYETVLVRYQDFEVEVPVDIDDWPTLARQNFTHRNQIDAMQELLGYEKWVEFNALYPRFRQLDDLVQAIMEQVGVSSSGNSRSSSE